MGETLGDSYRDLCKGVFNDIPDSKFEDSYEVSSQRKPKESDNNENVCFKAIKEDDTEVFLLVKKVSIFYRSHGD